MVLALSLQKYVDIIQEDGFSTVKKDIFYFRWYGHNGLPSSIIFDHDNKFIRQFWHALWGLIDTKTLKRSDIFHPHK